MYCLFQEVYQFYLAKKLPKYQNTIVLKYGCITKFVYVYSIIKSDILIFLLEFLICNIESAITFAIF